MMFTPEPGQIYHNTAIRLSYEVIALVLNNGPCAVYQRTNDNVVPKSKHRKVQGTAPARVMAEMVKGFRLQEE